MKLRTKLLLENLIRRIIQERATNEFSIGDTVKVIRNLYDKKGKVAVRRGNYNIVGIKKGYKGGYEIRSTRDRSADPNTGFLIPWDIANTAFEK